MTTVISKSLQVLHWDTCPNPHFFTFFDFYTLKLFTVGEGWSYRSRVRIGVSSVRVSDRVYAVWCKNRGDPKSCGPLFAFVKPQN